jgi:hypothetical protein
LVELAALALDEADVPLATQRAERVARRVVAAYNDRPLRPLTLWSPDPEIIAPLEPLAPARDLDLYGEGFGAPYLEAGLPMPQTISTEGGKLAEKASPVI